MAKSTSANAIASKGIKDALRSEISREHAEKTVAVSHHVPTFLNYPEQFKYSPLNGAFGTELSGLIEMLKSACWIYGHHHQNIPEFEIDSTRMLTNQSGYVQNNEHRLFKTDRAVVV